MSLPSLNWERGLFRVYVLLSVIAWVIGASLMYSEISRFIAKEVVLTTGAIIVLGTFFQGIAFAIYKLIEWVVKGFSFEEEDSVESMKTEDLPEQ